MRRLLLALPAFSLLFLTGIAFAQGTVWSTGDGFFGQLGNGSFGYSNAPAEVAGLSGVVATSGGDKFSVALKNDGTVVAWGWNLFGQLGNGTTVNTHQPTPVTGLAGVTAIASGATSSVALLNDGTVRTWGSNVDGQLGNGNTNSSLVSVPALNLSGVTAIAGRGRHFFALKADGTVWAWGRNDYGQLGTPAGSNNKVPTQLTSIEGVTGIDGSMNHTIAVKGDGTVWTWGHNNLGQLGNGTLTGSMVPIQVPGLTGVLAVAASPSGTSYAIKSDGTVWAWGYNGHGMLANGSGLDSKSPVQSGFAAIERVVPSFWHVSALKPDGTVQASGQNHHGMLGDNTYLESKVPVFSAVSQIVALGAGWYHALAVRNDGTVWTWGENDYGQLGFPPNRRNVSAETTLQNVVSVSAGNQFSVALTSDGKVWTWGKNEAYGALGIGDLPNQHSPVMVTSLSNIVRIDSSSTSSFAIKDDGTLWGWGDNFYRQLGAGSQFYQNLPVQVAGFSPVSAVSAGDGYTLAIKTNGSVWAWGNNSSGQLGDGTLSNRSSPVQVTALSSINVVAVAAGAGHSMALAADGTVWAWGFNSSGQLGNGTTTSSRTPVQVPGLAGVTSIYAGGSHSLAIRADGSVWAWGNNGFGQLGIGSTTSSKVPVQVSGLSGIVSISAGYRHTLAVRNDGAVWAWGFNTDGQLGIGTYVDSLVPIQAAGLSNVMMVAGGVSHSLVIVASANRAPTANAGSDQTLTVQHDGDPATNTASFTLDGTGSSDPDQGDVLSFEWKEGAAVVGNTATLSLSRVAGSYTFTLTVTDNHGASASDSVDITVNPEPNEPPTADAGPDQNVLIAGPSGNVTLAGGGDDPEDDALTFEWSEGGSVIATGAAPTVALAAGQHTLTLTVRDPYGAEDTDTVVISVKRYTTVTVPDVSGYPAGTAALTARLAFQSDGSAISGRTIAFKVGSTSVGTATTDGSGVASVSYTIPSATPVGGSLPITATFSGDDTLQASSGSGSLFVKKKPSLTVSSISGTIGATVILKATLRFSTAPLTNRTIRFKIDGAVVGTGTTDVNGLATLSHTLTESAGAHPIRAEFDGDTDYAPIAANGTLTVKPIKTSLSVATISALPNQTVNLKATLKAGTTLLSGRTVSFSIDGVAAGSATTDANGIALLSHTCTESLGTHAIKAEYAGDGVKYAASTGSGTLKIQAATKIVADVVSAPAGSQAAYGAKLTRSDGGAPLDGKTLSFYTGTTLLGSAVTDAAGRATLNLTAPTLGVKQAITVKFAGDTQYRSTSGKGSITGT